MTLAIIAVCSVCFTFLGGLLAIKFKDKLHLIVGFSAGSVLAVALFGLIPEAIETSHNLFEPHLIMLYVAIGFITYMIFDRAFSIHNHGDEHHCDNHSHSGKFGAFSIIAHTMMDGLGIGLAFQVNPVIGIIIAAAVLTHNFSDGLNTVAVIFREQGKNTEAFKFLMMAALAPVIGIILSFFIVIPASIFCILVSIFAGFFLYLSASQLLPESYHHHPTFWTTIMTILGMSVIYMVISTIGC